MLSVRDLHEVKIDMPPWINEEEFQNVIFECCGLVQFTKWGVQHDDTTCAYDGLDVDVIKVSCQDCPMCHRFCGGVIQLARHFEEFHGGIQCNVCVMCRNPYLTKVALDCHIYRRHGGSELVKRDSVRKYILS